MTQALLLDQEDRMDVTPDSSQQAAPFYEVTVASVDQPKLLSRLSEALVSLSRYTFDFVTCLHARPWHFPLRVIVHLMSCSSRKTTKLYFNSAVMHHIRRCGCVAE